MSADLESRFCSRGSCLEMAEGAPGAQCLKCRIASACATDGYSILTEGTSDPGLVISRLLDALRRLSPEAHELVTATWVSIPADAMVQGTHPWWDLPAADAVLSALVQGLQEHAPDGFFFGAAGDWCRLGYFPLAGDLPATPALAVDMSNGDR